MLCENYKIAYIGKETNLNKQKFEKKEGKKHALASNNSIIVIDAKKHCVAIGG